MTSPELSHDQVILGYTLFNNIGAYSNKNIFQVRKNQIKYAMKMFTYSQNIQFQRQSYALENLNHPNIIKMIEKVKEACVHPNLFNHNQSGTYNLIITEMAPHGNICECLEKIQCCSEDITRTYITQLLEALIFSKQKNILHGPVKGYDILIDEDRSVKLCGWTQAQTITQESLRQLVFSIGQIIILMMTGHPPFARHSQNDALFKFINQKNIKKFWESIGKRVKQKLPQQMVELCCEIFLNKQFSLEDILKSGWIQQGRKLQLAELKGYFKERQQEFQQKKYNKRMKIAIQKSKFDKIREEMSENTRGQIACDQFIIDYFACNLTVSDLQIGVWSPQAIIIKQKLSFVVAWIKKVFEDAIEAKDSLIYPISEMYLHEQSVYIEDNQLKIKLQFMNRSQEEQVIEENDLLQATVKFFRDSQDLIYALVDIDQQSAQQQNDFYVKKLKRFIQSQLLTLNSSFQGQNNPNSKKKQQMQA